MLEHDKMIAIFHNESSLGYPLGKDTATGLMDNDNAAAVIRYHDDHPKKTYSQNFAKKRASEKVKDLKATSRDILDGFFL
jgi:hypothetical protein